MKQSQLPGGGEPAHEDEVSTPPSPQQGSQFFSLRFVLRLVESVAIHEFRAATIYALLARAHGQGTGKGSLLPDGVVLNVPERGRLDIGAGKTFAFGIGLIATDPSRSPRICSPA